MTNVRSLLKARKNRTSTLGDVIAAAFDSASRVTSDPARATLIAALRVNRLLRRMNDHREAMAVRAAA
jgi:hypothetical protein